MAELVLVRPVHFQPGRQDEAVAWARQTEPIRREYGLLHQWVIRGMVDQSDCQLIQVWQSEEAYRRWKESDDRKRLVEERSRYAGHDPTKQYRVL